MTISRVCCQSAFKACRCMWGEGRSSLRSAGSDIQRTGEDITSTGGRQIACLIWRQAQINEDRRSCPRRCWCRCRCMCCFLSLLPAGLPACQRGKTKHPLLLPRPFRLLTLHIPHPSTQNANLDTSPHPNWPDHRVCVRVCACARLLQRCQPIMGPSCTCQSKCRTPTVPHSGALTNPPRPSMCQRQRQCQCQCQSRSAEPLATPKHLKYEWQP